MSTEVMKMALEALEYGCNDLLQGRNAAESLRQAIEQAERNEFNPDWNLLEATQEALREYVAEIQRLRGLLKQAQPQQAEQEPFETIAYISCCIDKSCSKCKAAEPPQRQPLTDETLWEMWVESPSDVLRFARAIEAAHGIGEVK